MPLSIIDNDNDKSLSGDKRPNRRELNGLMDKDCVAGRSNQQSPHNNKPTKISFTCQECFLFVVVLDIGKNLQNSRSSTNHPVI